MNLISVTSGKRRATFSTPRGARDDAGDTTSQTALSAAFQVFSHGAAQLAAAVLVLINTLVAQRHQAPVGIVKAAMALGFANWALEAYVLAEAKRLTGVWLPERCTVIDFLGYDIRNWAWNITALFLVGAFFRLTALGLLFANDWDR